MLYMHFLKSLYIQHGNIYFIFNRIGMGMFFRLAFHKALNHFISLDNNQYIVLY